MEAEARLRSRRAARLMPLLGWIPLAAAAIYLAVMAWRLPTILGQIYRYGDSPALPLMARGWSEGRGPLLTATQTSVVAQLYDAVVAHTGWFTQLAMGFGPSLALLAAVLMWRGARKASDTHGSLLTLALALAIPPAVVWADLAQDNHIITVTGTALLGWHLMDLWRKGLRSNVQSAVVGLAMGVVVVDDPQALVSAILPAVVALTAIWLWERRAAARVIVPVSITFAGIGATAVLLPAVMRASGTVVIPAFAPAYSLTGIVRGLRLGGRGLVWMESGGWYGDPLSLGSLAGVVLTLLTVALPFIVVVRAFRRHRAAAPNAPPQRLCHAVYWAASGMGLAAAFLLSGDSHLDIQAHYIIGVFYAAAALLAHLGANDVGGRLRSAAAAAATVVIVSAAIGVGTLAPAAYAGPEPLPADQQVADQLQTRGLVHGYADYWDAYDVTWLSGARLDVWPVIAGHDCSRADAVCPYGTSTDVGAYGGTTGSTFLILRSTGPGCVRTAPSYLGPPTSTWRQGDLTVVVYPYDIGTRFVPDHAPLCTGP